MFNVSYISYTVSENICGECLFVCLFVYVIVFSQQHEISPCVKRLRLPLVLLYIFSVFIAS